MSAKKSDSEDPAKPRFTAAGVRRGAVQILPLAAFVLPFGVAFGVASTTKGLPPGIGLFMSAAMNAGAAQFSALDLWYAPLPLATLALTVLAVNGRLILVGAVLAPWLLRLPVLQRLAALVLTTDATFAASMAARERGEVDAGFLFGAALAMWTTWIAGTGIGILAGSVLGDLSRFGVDAVMVTYFTAVIIGQRRGRADALPWLAAAAVALTASLVLPTGWHIIAGALAGGLVGAWRHG